MVLKGLDTRARFGWAISITGGPYFPNGTVASGVHIRAGAPMGEMGRIAA